MSDGGCAHAIDISLKNDHNEEYQDVPCYRCLWWHASSDVSDTNVFPVAGKEEALEKIVVTHLFSCKEKM